MLTMKQSTRLRVLRAERELTQIDVAVKAALPENRYWRIENGYSKPSDDEQARIAKVFKLPVGDVFPATQAVAS